MLSICIHIAAGVVSNIFFLKLTVIKAATADAHRPPLPTNAFCDDHCISKKQNLRWKNQTDFIEVMHNLVINRRNWQKMRKKNN